MKTNLDKLIKNNWVLVNKSLKKDFNFPNFPKAINFMVQLVDFCEKTNHHPDWSNNYNKVIVSLTTHQVKKITKLDIALANKMEQVYAKIENL